MNKQPHLNSLRTVVGPCSTGRSSRAKRARGGKQCPLFLVRPNAGLTLIETLMVIGIIGVLIGLLLPAVQSIREGARANQCRNNLSQMWLATHTYHDAFNVFPAGTLSQQTPVRYFPEGYHHGWLVRIRGEMDGGTLFTDKLDSSRSVYAPANWNLQEDFYINTFSCPSSHVGWNEVATNYAAIHDGRVAPIDATSRGAFIANRFLRRDDFADGLSTTLFMSEKRVVQEELPDLSWLSGTQATLRTTGIPIDVGDRSSSAAGGSLMGMSESIPYGYFREKNPQTHDQFVRTVAGDPNLDLETLDAADWEAIIERVQTMPLPVAPRDAEKDMGGDTLAETAPDASSGEAVEPFDEDADEYGELGGGGYGYGEYGYGEYGLNAPEFPAPQVGPAGLEPRGLGSYHQYVVHAVTGDGRMVTISTTVDAKVFSGMGIRDDALPLVLPQHLQR